VIRQQKSLRTPVLLWGREGLDIPINKATTIQFIWYSHSEHKQTKRRKKQFVRQSSEERAYRNRKTPKFVPPFYHSSEMNKERRGTKCVCKANYYKFI
jgi:hypothetical protein